MKKLIKLIGTLLFLSSCFSCSNEHKHDYILKVTKDSYWKTFVEGSSFIDDGLEVSLICNECKHKEVIEYTLENNTNLSIDQKSVTIKYQDYKIEYPIIVKEKYHVACIGDSLTRGHAWPNESYPSFLSNIIDDKYEIKNCGVNGISITGYGGSWNNPDYRYIKQSIYQESLDFNPDILVIMLGSNDANKWDNARHVFKDDYQELLDSYLEELPNSKIIMMVSPPVNDNNNFDIKDYMIKDYVNPIQRELATEYDFYSIDLREIFENTPNYQTSLLRPNDGVHLSIDGATLVANKVNDLIKEITF